ncbi:MAG TPA: cytochrome c-type biogenesis protein CcmH [Thermodesulfobacteriota bacterium]|nr:cytochrome c-type biogenesis protein CcmH [Thermodesulfobacteriota bacterium]
MKSAALIRGGLSAAFLCAFLFMLPSPSFSLTVQEVARELECPCDCPLVLEDCNMSCGLEWKDQIGEQIKAGKTKDEIVAAFIKKYGEACRITPTKRIRGKIFQYTRGFGTGQWVLLGAGAAVWLLALFFGAFLIVRKFSRRKGGDNRE